MKLHRAQFLPIALIGAFTIGTPKVGAQAQLPATLVGSWRADTPLPSGMVQTFRFDGDGSFDLLVAVAVDGQYRVEGNKLIETVALPGTGLVRTDTAAVLLRGDSLTVGDASSSTSARTLHRPPRAVTPAGKGITGEWVIMLPNGTAASYRFDPDGTSHVRAQVSDERGTYTTKGDTLRLSNERSFQLPATTVFSITGSVLTLTPANGQGSHSFHKISAL